MSDITITVPGTPIGKARARAAVRHGRITHYLPANSRSYEDAIKLAGWREMRGKQPFDVPVHLELNFVFEPPPSWSASRKAAAIAGEIAHTARPDVDNIAKSWLDGLNRVVITDDKLVVKVTASKCFGPSAYAVCIVRPAEGNR
jgi:Holliday junction resolvase RusA-like endonuclease